MKGWRHLRKHGVEFNILCTVNAANEKHGRTVYCFFRDELGANGCSSFRSSSAPPNRYDRYRKPGLE